MKRLRQKHFRRYLLTQDELRSAEHVEQLHPRIVKLYQSWRDEQLSDVEVVCEYILSFLRIYRPRDYLGGPHNQIGFAPSLPESVQIFGRFSLRSVPLAVNRAIVGWAEKRYPLHLLDFVPTAEELLKWQVAGERVVTCLFKPEELMSWVNESRDPLGFVLHDLIHADHFFHDPVLCASQIDFYREVQQKLVRGQYAQILNNPACRANFEYIVSDMNSHPAHLRACLLRLERASGSVTA